jgi:glycine oxidase
VRGQIALLQAQPGLLRGHVCIGKRYLVPREDGQVLVGSTEEDAGFVAETTDAAIAELVDFARQVVPALSAATLTQAWAGLRPQSTDGLPTLGLAPHADNLWIATGHYRGGIQLSPVTAVCLADLIWSGEEKFDLSAFDPGRWLGSTA